jgi:hypothetical protein
MPGNPKMIDPSRASKSCCGPSFTRQPYEFIVRDVTGDDQDPNRLAPIAHPVMPPFAKDPK